MEPPAPPKPAVPRHKSLSAMVLPGRSKSRLQFDTTAEDPVGAFAGSAATAAVEVGDDHRPHYGGGRSLAPAASTPLPFNASAAAISPSLLAISPFASPEGPRMRPTLNRSRTYREISLMKIYQVGWWLAIVLLVHDVCHLLSSVAVL